MIISQSLNVLQPKPAIILKLFRAELVAYIIRLLCRLMSAKDIALSLSIVPRY